MAGTGFLWTSTGSGTGVPAVATPLLGDRATMMRTASLGSLQWSERAAVFAGPMYGAASMLTMAIMLRLWGEAAPQYAFFWCLAWAVSFILLFAGMLAAKAAGGWRPSEMDTIRAHVPSSLVSGLLLTANYLFISTASPHVGGPTQVVITQLPLVITVLVSCTAFSRWRAYSWMAWAGLGLVAGGVMVSGFLQAQSSDTPKGDQLWLLVFAAGNIPLGINPVINEATLQSVTASGQRLTVELRLLLTNVVVLFGLVAVVPAFEALDQPTNLGAALACVTEGENSLPGDDCRTARWILPFALLVSGLQMHSQSVLAQRDSGMIAVVVLSLAPFFANAVYPFLPGRYAEDPSIWAWVGCATCTVGVVLYMAHERAARLKFGLLAETRIVRFFLGGQADAEREAANRGVVFDKGGVQRV